MPNYCSNVVRLRHADLAMLAKARDGFAAGTFLNTFIPCPEALQNTEAAYYPHGSEKAKALAAREEKNIAEYGFKNWYDWRIASWGTKWDVGDENNSLEIEDGVLTLKFDSAWSPPITAYQTLEDEHDFQIDALYYEPGMAFCGSYSSGVDDCVEFSSDIDNAAKVIPVAIDQEFGIIASMREWEQELLNSGDQVYD